MKFAGIHTISVLLLFIVMPEFLAAQSDETERYSFDFRGESLEYVLDHITRIVEIDLVYDPQIIRGIHIYKRINNQPFPALLQKIFEETDLDYITLSSGTYVIVRKVEQKPAFGTFSGSVTDRDTGDPLPGATVLLADISGGTTTNRAGIFSLPKLISGSYDVIFSYVGYEPVYISIDIKPGNHLQQQIQMKPKPVDIQPVVVEAHRPRLPNQGRNDSSINPNTEWTPAGFTRDPIRSLNLSSGIQYGLPMTDLHLQGGQQSEHRIMLDGVPIYNPHSFGQLFSSFSPFAIGSINLHKAGFNVEEGSQISGIVNLNHDLAYSEKNQGILHADPLSVNARGNFHIPAGNSGLNIMTALRTNVWDVFKEPTLKNSLSEWNFIDPLITNQVFDLEGDAAAYRPSRQQSDVQFFDYHLATGYKINAYSTLSASLYLADNSVTTELLSEASPEADVPPFLYANDSYSWNNAAGQITWNNVVSPRFDISVNASYSASSFRHTSRIETSQNPNIGSFDDLTTGTAFEEFRSARRFLPIQIDGNRIRHFTLQSDGSYSVSPRFQLDGGIRLERVTSNVDLDDRFFLPADTRQRSVILSSYINGEHRFGDSWNAAFGTRFTYLNNSIGRLFLEPRASVQYDNPDSKAGYWSVRFTGGLHRQFINQHDITNAGPTSIVPSITVWSHAGDTEIPKAVHFTGSFFIEPAEGTTIKFESFYKWQPKATITSYTNLNTGFQIERDEVTAFAETTTMRAFGSGIRVNQELAGSRINLMAGYDYSFSRIDFSTQFGKSIQAPWNEPHSAQFRTLWHILPNVSMLGKWQGIWGRAWAFRQSYYNFLLFQDLPGFSFDNPENDKLKSFQQVDLSFIYRPSFGGTGFEFRVELINILNRLNTIDQSLLPVQNSEEERLEIRERTLPGFYPSASVQFSF
ncbi:MAG: carboxypeptidase-like regulatory domain-containing protein [Balneolaceae bacterium]